MRRVVVITIVWLLIIAAANGLNASADNNNAQINQSGELVGTSWQLVKFQGSDDTTLTPDDKSKYTIAFGKDDRVTARVDCNRGMGTWKSSGPNHLRFGPLALTRAMCPKGSLHDQIAKHWAFVRSYTIKDGHLLISLMADGGIYEFEPLASPVSLAGKRWALTEVNGTPVESSRAYIEFDDKMKRFSGNGGCNRITGAYAVDGSRIKFSQAISTKMACIDNEVQKVETDFFNALSQATDFKIEGDVLSIYVRSRHSLTLKAAA